MVTQYEEGIVKMHLKKINNLCISLTINSIPKKL